MGTHIPGPEGLRVYSLAQDLAASVDGIARSIWRDSLARQLVRAADSVVLNIAEGAGHFMPGMKVVHYRIAHGSASECVAALTRLHGRRQDAAVASARRDANMVCIMLDALIRAQERRKTPTPPPNS